MPTTTRPLEREIILMGMGVPEVPIRKRSVGAKVLE